MVCVTLRLNIYIFYYVDMDTLIKDIYMQKPKLILGTASFGPVPYGAGVTKRIDLMEIEYILKAAKYGGIDMLEGSELYGCDEVLSDKFELIYKVKHPYSISKAMVNLKRNRLMGLLYHHHQASKSQDMKHYPNVDYVGASVYDFKQLTGQEEMIEVPLNIEDTRFANITAPCKLVRSVFGRGELLKKYTVKECLAFVKNNPTVQGVIVGVNSLKEMNEVLEAWNA
jgi:hypothetical protein